MWGDSDALSTQRVRILKKEIKKSGGEQAGEGPSGKTSLREEESKKTQTKRYWSMGNIGWKTRGLGSIDLRSQKEGQENRKEGCVADSLV